MKRRQFLQTAAAGVFASMATATKGSTPESSREPKCPNVLFLFSDQQHWQAMGIVDRFFDTPHQDELVRNGVLFERGFCTTPQCSASRSSILTGLYPNKTGVIGNIGAAGAKSPLGRKTIGSLFQKGGYYTGYFGKWHLGQDPVGCAGWNEGHNPQTRRKSTKNDADTARRGVEFLRERPWGDKPFALYLSFLDPHGIYKFERHPFEPNGANVPLPASWGKEKFRNKPPVQKQFMLEDQGKVIWEKERFHWEKYRDCYRSKVKKYDDYVGQVVAELKRQGLWENTIIVHTSDHGDMDANHRLIYKGPFMYEHMMRVPMVIRVPKGLGGIDPRVVRDLDVVNVDLAPTLLELTGLDEIECDGISLAPLLRGKPGQRRREFVIGQYYSKQRWVNPIRMLRTADFKYNRYIHWGEELYDLRNDPNELTNLAGDAGYEKTRRELAGELDDWMRRNDDPFPKQWPTTRAGNPI